MTRNDNDGSRNPKKPTEGQAGVPPRAPGGLSSGLQPGGEAHALRNATIAAGTKADGHEDLTAAETPEATRHLSDATLGPNDRDATAEAIARAAANNSERSE